MNIRHLRIHGDNIVECERSLRVLSDALCASVSANIGAPIYMPCYQLVTDSFTYNVDLLSGHGRWNVDLGEELSKHFGILKEGADSYITEVNGSNETILLAVEYCSALPAGNNAWQRNGRAFSTALAGVPYLYYAELGGVELNENREVKAPRFPNPIVPFSYLMCSKRLSSFCMPVYAAHPSISESLYKKYESVFGYNDSLRLIQAIIEGRDYQSQKETLQDKALKMVSILSDDRRTKDTLKGEEWKSLLESESAHQWLGNHAKDLVWKKKTAQKVLDSCNKTFAILFKKVLGYSCQTIGASELPICIIPEKKRNAFEKLISKLYPNLSFSFEPNKPIVVVWITGFKPHGDDSRPDRGLSPLAKMVIGDEAQILAIVSGPAKASVWNIFLNSPQLSAQNNGLWQAILNMCDYVLVDSKTCPRRCFYKTNAYLRVNKHPISFPYVKPTISFGEHDTDTTIHQLFSRKEQLGIMECMCNPPGGDWSGISYFENPSQEYRWTSLPRVSEIQGKRPDHVIQILGEQSDVVLSIESKLNGSDLEANIGINLKTYLQDLYKTVPTALRTSDKDWRLYLGESNVIKRNLKIISIGAFAYTDVASMQHELTRGYLDGIIAIEFDETCTIMHVLSTMESKRTIEDILERANVNFTSLKIQIH